MRYSMGYEVLLVEKKIVMTKEFARKAAVLGTEEHAIYMQLKTDYPTFAPVKYTITQKTTREQYGKLSYESMALLIGEWFPGDKAAMEEFESIKRQSKGYAGSYGIVKHWFLGKYQEKYLSYKAAKASNE